MIDDGFKFLGEYADIDPAALEHFFEIIGAPPNLDRLQVVIGNLYDVVSTSPFDEAPAFSALSSFDNHFLESLANALGELTAPTQVDLPACWFELNYNPQGYCSDYPIWAALIYDPTTIAAQDPAYRWNLSLVIRCCITQKARHSEPGVEISNACRHFRQTISGKSSLSLLQSLAIPDSLDSYVEQLQDNEGRPVADFQLLELLVRKIIGHIGKSRSRNNNIRSGSQCTQKAVADADELDGDDPEEQLLVQDRNTKAESKQLANLGLAPGEEAELRAISTSFKADRPTEGYTLRDHSRRQKGQIAHIKSNNQRLPFRYSQLTTYDITHSLQVATRLMKSEAIAGLTSKPELDPSVGVLIHLLIFIGRQVGPVLEMRIYDDFDEIPKTKQGLLAYIIRTDEFVLSIPSPKNRTPLKSHDKKLITEGGEAQLTEKDGAILVKAPTRFGKLLQGISRIQNREYRQVSKQALFPVELRAEIKKRLTAVISAVNKVDDTRITPTRLSQTLFDEIVAYTTDICDAYLITGQPFTTAEVSSHYYTVSGNYLQEIYHASSVRLRDRIYAAIGTKDNKYHDFEQSRENNELHGSKFHITPTLVQRLVEHLQLDLKNCYNSSVSATELHNRLVAYISFWILIETGYRGVNDLIYQLIEFDWKSGFLIVSDKDNDRQSNSRLIWLSQALRDQMKKYLFHLAALLRRLQESDKAYKHIDDILCNEKPVSALLFFISKVKAVIPLTPENLRQEVPIFTLPIYSGRDYIRTQLREMGCDAEYVNYYMGHWQKGQEPFGRFSTLSPFELKEALSPALEALRIRDGWSVMRGLADA